MFDIFRSAAVMLAVFAALGNAGIVDRRTPAASPAVTYSIDASRSKFMVVAPRGGPAWFKGHSHYLAVRDFSGTVELTPDVIDPASLTMSIRTASIEETGADFTAEQKKIIKKELEDIVLETAKFPEITFKSTDVQGSLKNGAMSVRIGGDITLHGVTRHVILPATVTVAGNELHAVGEFELNRKKFNVNATDAFHGLVRVRHVLKFTFDIFAIRS
ncbi:MAG TPA: YceI family protein [Pyrinomonadaceae bacterium]|nr:YceI family protein [Pyrinomonadaceae bacterium]